MTDDIERSRVVDAFDAAVSWWHQQLDEPIAAHDERPATAREYFEEVRGFDPETLDEWRLGWAPPDGGLFEHLKAEGFDVETIRATGLFTKNDTALWRGRYIMPYFSADGRAEYAIARCTGSKGGGAAGYDGHPEDFLAGKYAKIAHTRENVPLTEPILGLHTLQDASEVVVAEGIADAITAHEAGYAVLSPVTKEFKREHFELVVDAVEEHGIERVYVVPDAEIASFAEIDSDDVPDEPEHAYEAINVPTVAPGPGGGLRTANYLVEHGIDARVVDLPRPSADKVDLDDYLQVWADDLEAVLASAKPPAEHPQYDAATATQSTDDAAETTSDEHDGADAGTTPSTTEGSRSRSGLFTLDVGDVNPDLEAGFRGKNPLGHVGNSENYFVVTEHPETGDLIGKDYKRPGTPRYTGCTYLLVEIDERPVEAPMGPLSPEETWKAWSEARQRGLLDAKDVIPTKALEYIARREELYNFANIGADADLPPKAHNRALWWVNERWPEQAGVDVDLDDDENATARSGRARDGAIARTWEDVRYIYESSKESGRAAARELLNQQYDFMTLANSDDELMLYDPDTGIYTDRTAPVRGEIYDGLGEHWSTHELNEILAGLRQHNVVPERDLNGYGLDGPHICVENGVLDPLNRELKDHSPDYYFVDRVPVRYDQDADAEPYEEFLNSLVDRDADRKAMVEMVGHALMPDANERYKKFLILVGDADNGKSAFFARVRALLNGPEGEERNTSSVKLAKLTQNRFSMNSMYGHMANIAGEIDGKRIQNTASIKDITGGDSIEIEPKGGESFFDVVNTTLMFAANDPPIIGKRDKEAIEERIVPIELPHTFVDDPDGPMEKQARPERELKDELDDPDALAGFLNLALDGIERLEENHGDVSLPESPEERLRQYERTADPMREFGERCLENSPDSYLVKADITTMYREFATANGYELGDNISRVLHNVLRGVPNLNYTDSRPENPDYSDTDLPLRGWNERKRVVNRVTLTEEGMKYAESAGLIEEADESDKADDQGDEPTPLAALSLGRQAFTAKVATVSDGEYSREAQGDLQGHHGTYVDFVIPGDNDNPLAGKQGSTFHFENVKLRTNDDGLREAVIRDSTTVTAVDGFDDPADASGADQSGAATDGGTKPAGQGDDAEPVDGDRDDADGQADGDDRVTLQQLRETAEKYVRENHNDRDNGVPHDEVVARVAAVHGVDAERVERVVEQAIQRNSPLHEPTEGHYRV